jgi:hypothetical protein
MWPRRRARRGEPARYVSPPPAAAGTDRTGIDFGWRAHEAVQGWTASVDIKASIVLVVETAVAGAATQALITRLAGRRESRYLCMHGCNAAQLIESPASGETRAANIRS